MVRLSSINIICICILLSFYSCRCIKDFEQVECSEIPYDAINIAINDFLKSKTGKDKKVSSVWVTSECSNDLFRICLWPNYVNDIYVDKYDVKVLQENIGKNVTWIPSEFVEKSSKLFYWMNPNLPLDQKMIDALTKYDLTCNNKESFIINEGPYLLYYFCRNNPKRYKKTTSCFGPLNPCIICR